MPEDDSIIRQPPRAKCPNCNAAVEILPGQKRLRCLNCKYAFEAPDVEKFRKG